jgi:hypothetical protein
MVYSPVSAMRTSSRCCLGESLGCLAELAFRPGHGHALSGSHPQQVDFEFGEGGEDVEDILPMGPVGS